MSSSVLNRVFFFSNVTGRIAAFKPSINTLIETNSHISHKGCFKISLQLTKKKTIGKQIPQQFSLVSASQTLQFCLGGKSTKEIIATFLTVMVSRGNWVVLTWNYCVMWYYKVSFGFVNTVLMRSIYILVSAFAVVSHPSIYTLSETGFCEWATNGQDLLSRGKGNGNYNRSILCWISQAGI